MGHENRSAAIRGLLSAGLLCLLLSVSAAAAVSATQAATGEADAVYVAGNPDWYPVEYYDQDTQSYAGLLPAMLELVSEKIGIDFIYVQAGPEDQRQRLGENKQVELISGCAPEETWLRESGMQTRKTLLSVPGAEGEREVCLAFTPIADEALVRKVEHALAALTPQEISSLSAAFIMDHPGKVDWRPLALCAAVVLLLVALAAVQAVKLRRYKRKMQQNPQMDSLTGLGNKTYFAAFFERFISDQYRNLYSVIYLGFDIARVNHYYGETAAEDQLHFAANELKLSIRDNEAVARISGGGFAVVRPSSGERTLENWTQQLLDRLNAYTERYGQDYRPVFRAGIYPLEMNDRDCETALFNARQGYQQAVEGNRPYVFARIEHLEQENERLQLKKQMLDALQNQEFQMFLQFIVRSEDGKVCGAEAVSRWDHPQKGLLYPGSYIALMEAEGTIAELDFYIFEASCRQLHQWQREGRQLQLSCNFARVTISREDFVQRIRSIAGRYVFDRCCLVIEITEDIVETNRVAAFTNITQCKEMGFLIAMDDVGSGYTSFADLRDYPIDVVKIDRSILNAAVTQRGIALLRGIITLAHNLDMEVLCEGAETQVQAEMLREIGCDYIQGYYFYRPLPQEEAVQVLEAGETRC